MNKIGFTFLMCLLIYGSEATKAPGPSVFVVTPSPRSNANNEARSAPFYYHNWMRRMDAPQNATSTTAAPKVKTPDLIFAEFESESEDNMRKSIRKLLEQERVAAKATSTTTTTTTTTPQPIYVPENYDQNENNEYQHPTLKDENKKADTKKNELDMTDYFALYNNLYGDVGNNPKPNEPRPIYVSSPSSTTSTTTSAPANVENIWHIIDSEKHNHYSDSWEEVNLNSNSDKDQSEADDTKVQDNESSDDEKDDNIPDNFALPGFSTNHGNGAENESRAIRTEPNIRFPYVSLKPFVMKNLNKPSNSKKGSNMFNLGDFKEIQQPVRGEIQDTVSIREPIDRYNPAQPYLPQEYGSKSKQSSPSAPPSKAVANLVPPPPPPPKITGDDFPAPTSYESFPPYPPSGISSGPPASPPSNPPVSVYKPPLDSSDGSGPDSSLDGSLDNAPVDVGYRYNKPPSQPAFVPTLPPLSKPFKGYSYDKPPSMADSPPAMDMSGYTYNKPAMTLDSPPPMDMGGYTYNKPSMTFDSAPAMGPDNKPDFHQYLYDKPHASDDHNSPSYDHGPPPPSFHQDNDYPELIFDKPHGGGGIKGGHDAKGGDVAMMPPPPPPDMKPDMDSGPPSDDHGFPPDFPGDLKFHHDFDDHDFHHYHHHHPTTTTTTTEMPRVNRFSYYYLGKKLYYLPLYFSVYFIVYVGALIIKAVLRHKIVYPNSWRPNGTTATFFSKRSVDSWDLSNENLHEVTGRVTKAIAEAAEKYMNENAKSK